MLAVTTLVQSGMWFATGALLVVLLSAVGVGLRRIGAREPLRGHRPAGRGGPRGRLGLRTGVDAVRHTHPRNGRAHRRAVARVRHDGVRRDVSPAVDPRGDARVCALGGPRGHRRRRPRGDPASTGGGGSPAARRLPHRCGERRRLVGPAVLRRRRRRLAGPRRETGTRADAALVHELGGPPDADVRKGPGRVGHARLRRCGTTPGPCRDRACTPAVSRRAAPAYPLRPGRAGPQRGRGRQREGRVQLHPGREPQPAKRADDRGAPVHDDRVGGCPASGAGHLDLRRHRLDPAVADPGSGRPAGAVASRWSASSGW